MGIESGLVGIGLEYIIWMVGSIFNDRKSIYGPSVSPFLKKKVHIWVLSQSICGQKVHIWTVNPYMNPYIARGVAGVTRFCQVEVTRFEPWPGPI